MMGAIKFVPIFFVNSFGFLKIGLYNTDVNINDLRYMDSMVLTKEQMCELESLGFDISDASMYYWLSIPTELSCKDESITFVRNRVGKWCLNGKENCMPTYTLSDLLKKLPRYIQPFLEYETCIANGNNEDKWKLVMFPFTEHYWIVKYVMNDYVPKDNGYCDEEYHRDDTFHSEIGKTLLEAVFKMLKWLKEEETKRDKVKYLNC